MAAAATAPVSSSPGRRLRQRWALVEQGWAAAELFTGVSSQITFLACAPLMNL
jgi:hypothetical protein